MRFIEKTWSKLANNAALKYTFADEQLEQLYTKDNQLAERLNYFSFIALFISCLGIFGIMSISIRERTKELGIRKVVGAPFKYLVWLMLKDYFAIIGIASILGGLLGMYVANQWLRNFEYRISFGIDHRQGAHLAGGLQPLRPPCEDQLDSPPLMLIAISTALSRPTISARPSPIMAVTAWLSARVRVSARRGSLSSSRVMNTLSNCALPGPQAPARARPPATPPSLLQRWLFFSEPLCILVGRLNKDELHRRLLVYAPEN